MRVRARDLVLGSESLEEDGRAVDEIKFLYIFRHATIYSYTAVFEHLGLGARRAKTRHYRRIILKLGEDLT